MIQIIPAINAATWEEVYEKIRRVEHHAPWIHIDIADGTFTKNTLWHNPLDFVGFDTVAKIEIHMMEAHPEDRVEAWFFPCVKRIIVHDEVVHDFDFIRDACHREKREVGIAVAPDTSWTHFKRYIGKADLFQVLAVHPGTSGQEFQGDCYSKIRHLRALCGNGKIEVDGGIIVGVARHVVEMGADMLATASAVFGAEDPEKAIRVLQNDAAAGVLLT